MTTYFRHIGQITARADYEKLLRQALSKPGEEPFHHLDEFVFDKKTGPLLLVGDIGKPLLEEIKKATPKAVHAKGVCTVSEQGPIVLAVTGGKLKQRVLAQALKASGIKTELRFDGADDGDQDAPTAPAPKTTPASTTQGVAPPPKAPLSEAGQQWQSGVKLLRPKFEQVLLKARALKGSTWADDLDGTFSQMLQEAKAGRFEQALKTMALLARMMKSEEAARAEVKHQTNKALDSDYAQNFETPTEALMGKRVAKEMRRSSKADGYGLTEDGHITYALAVTPAQWLSDVSEPLVRMAQDARKGALRTDALSVAVHKATQVLTRLDTHTAESGKAMPERSHLIERLQVDFGVLLKELARLDTGHTPVKDAQALDEQTRHVVDLALRSRPGKGSGQPTPQQLEAFQQQAPQRKTQREEELRELKARVRELTEAVKRQEHMREQRQAVSQTALARDHEALNQLIKEVEETERRHTQGLSEKEDLKAFVEQFRWPPRVGGLSKTMQDSSALIRNRQFDKAAALMQRRESALFEVDTIDLIERNSPEHRLWSAYQDLCSDLLNAHEKQQASPKMLHQQLDHVARLCQDMGPLLK